MNEPQRQQTASPADQLGLGTILAGLAGDSFVGLFAAAFSPDRILALTYSGHAPLLSVSPLESSSADRLNVCSFAYCALAAANTASTSSTGPDGMQSDGSYAV